MDAIKVTGIIDSTKVTRLDKTFLNATSADLRVKEKSNQTPRLHNQPGNRVFLNRPLIYSLIFITMRTSYAAEAIGFVQVKREQHRCNVKTEGTPEHWTRSVGYNVELVIKEAREGNYIIRCKCKDCPAAAGNLSNMT